MKDNLMRISKINFEANIIPHKSTAIIKTSYKEKVIKIDDKIISIQVTYRNKIANNVEKNLFYFCRLPPSSQRESSF